MKNRLRRTGNIWADTVLALVVISTLVVLIYGWVLDFPEGFPQRREAVNCMLWIAPLTLLYFVLYVVFEGLILAEEVEEYNDKAED